ncbi:MAG: sodium:calcium antiporter [Methanocalculus sp. MSAO_Arc1]|uniref:calcium/sodium antiporter n=1 Tax=Methanocalculus TaxID=71151 RepID=UPI000FF821CA|nr:MULTISPECIES: calcium/sodium antiporter [unclassified Methanocalculus]MCP1662956.1 cation:H+ antiporter [Methanocalculus sp. AMF5]RQD81485.1 MAG: sodium:calcium antiporter [Methanocalculus sp. MSAO_Arc1]
MFLEAALFITGLALLVKGADFFVGGGSGLASRFGVTPSLIGFTVVAFGTSLPEFVVSANASLTGNPGIATGNILGSNIANIALVLAVCGILKPSILNPHGSANRGIRIQALLMLAATALFLLVAWQGTLSAPAGVILLIAFVIILRILWKNCRDDGDGRREPKGALDILMTAGGLAAVIIGSQLVVTSAVGIADSLGVSAFLIGLTIVAIGTSLPELATSVAAIKSGESGISVGNLLGSNIFNLLFVLGIIALITELPIQEQADLLVMAAFTLAVIPIILAGERLTRFVSFAVLIGYCTYIAHLAGLL